MNKAKFKKFIFKNVSTRNGTLAIALCGLLIVGGSLSYLSFASGSLTNVFAGDRNKVNVGIVEKKSDGSTTDAYETGDGQTYTETLKSKNENTVTKEFGIKNIDNTDYHTGNTLVRVRIVPSFKYDVEGNAHDDNTTVAADMKLLTLKVTSVSNDGNWYVLNAGGENYYYYTAPVARDKVTSDLKVEASYSGVVPKGAHFQLEVLTEGVSYNDAGTNKFKFAEAAWDVDYVSTTTATTITGATQVAK